MTSRTAPRPVTALPVDHAADAPMIRSRPRLRPWILFTVAVVLAFFSLIYSRIALDRTAFDLQKLNGAIAAEETRHWQLRSDVARMQSPERITTLAGEMGMVYPSARTPLAVQGVAMSDDVAETDLRWSDLKALLSARP
jgi:cell division protein FtsL